MAATNKKAQSPLPKCAASCTLKVPCNGDGVGIVLSWCRWHLNIGFDTLFLFFDEFSCEEEVAGSSSKQAPLTSPPAHPAAQALAAQAEFGDGRVVVLASRDLELLKWQEAHCPSWAALSPFAGTEVPPRQCLNAEVALELARRAECDWLLHLDIDELFFTGPPTKLPSACSGDGSGGGGSSDAAWAGLHQSAPKHFASLDSEGVGMMTYVNHEGVPEVAGVNNFFNEVTLFRRHHFTVPLSADARRGMRFWEQRTNHGQYLLVYDCGKSATRVIPGVKAKSVHTFELPATPSPVLEQPDRQQKEKPAVAFATSAKVERGNESEAPLLPPQPPPSLPNQLRKMTALCDPRSLDVSALRRKRPSAVAATNDGEDDDVGGADCPCVLHYVTCGERWFTDKYKTLGSFESSWFGGKLPIAPSFHLDARDVVCSTTRSGTETALAAAHAAPGSCPGDDADLGADAMGALTTVISADASAAVATLGEPGDLMVTADMVFQQLRHQLRQQQQAHITYERDGVLEREEEESRHKRDRAIACFFQAQVLFDAATSSTEMERQIAAGVLMRIDTVASALLAHHRMHHQRPEDSLEQANQVQAPPHPAAPETTNMKANTATVTTSASESTISTTDRGSSPIPTPTPLPVVDSTAEMKNFERAWILSSIAQRYL